MANYSQKQLSELMNQFIVYGDYVVAVPFGSGHVNDTFQVTFDQGGIRLHYTLQRVNRNVFSDPVKVMENVDKITAHILDRIRRDRQEQQKRTLRLLRTSKNMPYVFDKNGDLWRAYVFVERARAYDVLEDSAQAYRMATAFGEFQNQLVDFPCNTLHETIPDFHNTPKRIEQLEEAIKLDPKGRAKSVAREIDFVMSRKCEAGYLIKLYNEGAIPERITHNDTKSSNILFDDLTGEGVCILDLDTVMPGLAIHDFGDMVRSATTSAEEDEMDLDKVEMRFDMYEALHRGYLLGTGDILVEAERECLAESGRLITLETGCRFLTDYINGDVYFKIRRPNHNLDRARNQFKLVTSIESQMDAMKSLLIRG
ncbi:MAG: aminoglycoside phosphotransferase family protein [Victivallaceae bacterium]|nr:aminoglycoside phosphotransferase family protein [Victivallaceae bacterium]